jgi:murein L,D-transpeptidase YcbB/YkuD
MREALKLLFQGRTDLTIRHNLYFSRLILFFAVSLSASPISAQEPAEPKTGVAQEIFTILSAKQHPDLTQPNFANRSEDIDNLYKFTNYQLLWLGRADSEKNIAETLNLLANASSYGLNPNSYDLDLLKQNLLETLKQDSLKRQALYDTALSLSLLRFLHDLHYGRINPQGINFKLKLREKKLADLPALIKAGLGQGTLAKLPELVEPKLIQYQKLKQALVLFRQLDAKSAPLQFVIKKSLRPGDRHPQIDQLKQFLITLGDLMPEEQKGNDPKKLDLYTSKISDGVKKFQLRHGLAADGVIGKGTAAEISLPLKQRITQIELALERLRWLPEINAGAYIIVNIPAFQLWAFDDISKNSPVTINMKVVVGKALKNQTPVLMAEMRFIDFLPYWNVPYSIVKDEILPKLMQNPDYLIKENMEIVTGFDDQAKTVAVSNNALLQLKLGTLKIRQRPGPKNALGRIKFMFPNKEDVYLHDTPANALFNRSRRDFSHGCVRVENPEDLAYFALKDQKGWGREEIKQAIKADKTKRVILKKSIPVLFFYTTAFVDQNDRLTFYPDIYGHDAVLLEALKKPEDLSDQSLFVSKNTVMAQTTHAPQQESRTTALKSSRRQPATRF